jgi:hypothetical protein
MTDQNWQFAPIPDRAPPGTAVGPVAWIRDNLFGSVSSSLTTLLFLYLFFTYVPLFIDWAILSANWKGSDRSVSTPTGRAHCWTFIGVRLEQICSESTPAP